MVGTIMEVMVILSCHPQHTHVFSQLDSTTQFVQFLTQNSLYGVADPSLASSHWLWPDLDTPGCYLFFNDLILIMLNGGLGWTKMSNIWICECLDRLEHLDLDRLAHLDKLA